MKRSRPLKREFSVTQNPLEMRDKANQEATRGTLSFGQEAEDRK